MLTRHWGIRRHRLVPATIAAALLLLSAAACAPPPPPPAGNHNLLLVTLDTVRADFLEPYGFEGRSSPNLAAFAGGALLFEQAFATAPRTSPSHASILTGRHPGHHGVLFNGFDMPVEVALGADSLTLAEHLRQAGFFTGGIVSAGTLDERYGFQQGFDTFESEGTRKERQKPEAGGGADEVTVTALRWLKKHRGERFFLWIHYYEAHSPFHSPPEVWEAMGMAPGEIVTMESARSGEQTLASIRRSYQAEIFELDAEVGRLLDGLDELGLDGGTLVAMVGDHGEYLGEHGYFGHQELYDEMLHVPMIIRSPTLEPGRRPELVSTIDLAPTLLGLLGVPPLPGGQGVDLLDPGQSPPDVVFAEWRNHQPWLGQREARPRDLIFSARSSSAKVIYDRPFPEQSMAFDIERDAGEQVNLYGAGDPLRPDLEEVLRRHLDTMPAEALSFGEMTLDPKTAEMLRSLGYIEAQ